MGNENMGDGSRSCDCAVEIQNVEKCCIVGREKQTILSEFDGTLLRSSSAFPYYMLVALEAGGPFRAFVLLLLSPVILLVQHCFSKALAIQILVFVSMAGLKVSVISQVARAVLPKFYLEDMHPHSYRVFISCGTRYVVTCHPRIMVEPFLKTHMGVDHVSGTELLVTKEGVCAGILSRSGVLMDGNTAEIVRKIFGNDPPDVGLGNQRINHPFLPLCKEAFSVRSGLEVDAVPREQYLTPLVFHDGRLVMRPTPLASLAIVLWMPIGFVLAVIRISVGLTLPVELAVPCIALLGMTIRVKGAPPIPTSEAKGQGVLFASTHRCVLDPTHLSIALRRKIRAVVYSVSRVSEWIAPIKTAHLTRDREADAKIIQSHLQNEDLFVCPEGTTCREPFLLRFSPLFAELSDNIVPVAMRTHVSMFHGTTARGYKALDSFFFLMNPSPGCEIILLDPLPVEQTCAGGKSSIEVANFVQKQLADALGYQCTNFTRKDKYTILAGNDGRVKKPTSGRRWILQMKRWLAGIYTQRR